MVLIYINPILGVLVLAQGPSEKVHFVLEHRLALVLKLRNSVGGNRSSLVTQPSSHNIFNNGCATADT